MTGQTVPSPARPARRPYEAPSVRREETAKVADLAKLLQPSRRGR